MTYSNQAKHDMIGVDEQTLSDFGAVSEQVVCEMAKGALLTANADYAVSVSGIAGPGGGSEEKPVGLVWFGFAIKPQRGFEWLLNTVFLVDHEREVRAQSVIFL